MSDIREIKRNSSGQIISYTIIDDNIEYGSIGIPLLLQSVSDIDFENNIKEVPVDLVEDVPRNAPRIVRFTTIPTASNASNTVVYFPFGVAGTYNGEEREDESKEVWRWVSANDEWVDTGHDIYE